MGFLPKTYVYRFFSIYSLFSVYVFFYVWGLCLGIFGQRIKANELTQTEQIMAESRALAGSADAREMVGVDFSGFKVVN